MDPSVRGEATGGSPGPYVCGRCPAIAALYPPHRNQPTSSPFGPCNQCRAGLERFEVWGFVLGDAGEDLDLGTLEEVADQRGKGAWRHRQLGAVLGLEALEACLDQVAPTALGGAPTLGELGVGESGGPQLPEDPHVAGVDVLAQVFAGALPLLGKRPAVAEHRLLALQKALGEVFEDREQQAALGAEVVVDQRESRPGALGDGARRGPGIALLAQQVGGGGEQQRARRLALRDSEVPARRWGRTHVGVSG